MNPVTPRGGTGSGVWVSQTGSSTAPWHGKLQQACFAALSVHQEYEFTTVYQHKRGLIKRLSTKSASSMAGTIQFTTRFQFTSQSPKLASDLVAHVQGSKAEATRTCTQHGTQLVLCRHTCTHEGRSHHQDLRGDCLKMSQRRPLQKYLATSCIPHIIQQVVCMKAAFILVC